MKVGMIGHKDFPSRTGGVETVIRELAPRLVRRGHQVTVYNRGLSPGGIRSFEGVSIRRAFTMRLGWLDPFLSSLTATLHALFQDFDLLHYHALGPSVMLILARWRGIPTVATVHGLGFRRSGVSPLLSAYLRLGERIIARFADEVIVLSRSTQERFRTLYRRDTCLVSNGVESMASGSLRLLREQLSLEKNGYILFLARIVPEKGLHCLIPAFLRCATDKCLVIAGEIPDNAYGRQIRRLAGDCPRIRFTGFAQGELLKELYSGCLAYVLPSEVEGQALTLLEAMSAGARCLVSDIPENTEVALPFGSSFPLDEESLYRALDALFRGPEEHAAAERQKAYVREHYGYDALTQATEAVYRSALRRAAERKSERRRRGCP